MTYNRQTIMKIMFKRWTALCTGGLVLLVSLVLAACGGGGSIPWPGVSIRALDADFTSRMAVAYSPFRSAADKNGLEAEIASMPVAQIRDDLEKLRKAGFGMVRVFDTKVAAKTLAAIVQAPALDMKVMMGVWIETDSGESAAANAALNDAEISRAVDLATNPSYINIIKAVSVGNETQVSWNTWNPQTTTSLAAYLRKVRNQITQPVTTDDNWAFFAAQSTEKDPHPIFNEIDFISMHTYPFEDIKYGLWDWKQTSTAAGPQRAVAMMDAAIAKAKADYAAVRNQLDQYGYGRLPVIVGETGWKAVATGGEGLWASPINQQMYFDRLVAWKQQTNAPKTIAYFSGFDEGWKAGDNGWGLFDGGLANADRKARCTALALDSTQTLVASGGSCATADAKYYTPPVNQGVVTSSNYVVYADSSSYSGQTRPTGLVMGAWVGSAGSELTGQSSGEGSNAWQITPAPANWGWGVSWTLGGQEVDLSQFANGTLNFRIKTSYAGKIEVGFMTGTGAEFNAWDVYLPISPGQYGYAPGNEWSQVSIPIADLVKSGSASFGSNAPPASLQLGRVSNPFVIADRYAKTGKAEGTNDRTPILIDDIHWSR